MTLVLYNYSGGQYTWVGDTGVTSTAATATATAVGVSNNPMLVHAGRMMTRISIPLMAWEILNGNSLL
jgi:hypothetical protein